MPWVLLGRRSVGTCRWAEPATLPSAGELQVNGGHAAAMVGLGGSSESHVRHACALPSAGEASARSGARANAYDNAGAGWQGGAMPSLQRPLPAPDGGASAVVDDVARGLAAALGGELLGLYVHGSLVAGDFSPA